MSAGVCQGKRKPNGSACLAPKVWDLSYGRWLAQVADGLEVEQAYWVGMSFGGFILARLAEWGPERMLGSALLARSLWRAPLHGGARRARSCAC